MTPGIFRQYYFRMKSSLLLIGAVLTAFSSACAVHRPEAPEAAGEPGMLMVRGGRFTMGRDKGELNERPAHAVKLDGYAVDRTEVSAGDFAEFLNAVGNDGERYLSSDDRATVVIAQLDDGARDVRFKARPGYERHPANNVSWYGADAYCRWQGKRLPTEAEWEKAARGTDKRLFPWGKRAPQAGLAQFDQSWPEKGLDVLVPVDALAAGASPYGALNMAGNVLEWVNDWYRQNLCDFCYPEGERDLWLIQQLAAPVAGAPAPPAPTATEAIAGDDAARRRQAPPRNNPTGPTAGSFKVLRGGSWLDRLDVELATTRRFWLDPTQRLPNTGFRCVWDPAGRQESPPERDGPAVRTPGGP